MSMTTVPCPSCEGTAHRYPDGRVRCLDTGITMSPESLAQLAAAKETLARIRAGQPPSEALRAVTP